MEVKLSHRRDLSELSLPKFLLPLPDSTTFPSHSLSLKSWVHSKRSVGKHFKGLAERWRTQIQEMSRGQGFTEHLLVHVVKEGETLTSISQQYGVSIYLIAAANKNIVDVDFVFRGQLLNIPTSFTGNTQCQSKKSWLPGFYLQKGHWGSMNILDSFSSQKIVTTLTSHSLSHAKSSGYFLVLVPLMAFCIRCIIGAFHTRVAEDLGHQAVNESKGLRHGSKSLRWKSALSDIREPDILCSESKPDSNSSTEDLAQASFEEASHAYSKLEHDYQKFLSECGISKCGYWRGGSPK